MQRKEALEIGEIYHIYNKSIAGFRIFNDADSFLRMKNVFIYYQVKQTQISFAQFLQSKGIVNNKFCKLFYPLPSNTKIVQIVAYCIMPTHLHMILKQLVKNGISAFMGNILNSYSRYFNTKYNRKGPLWQSRFQNKRIITDKQLLHLTRYIHLNPVTDYLVEDPKLWPWSSYKEYISRSDNEQRLCEYNDILNIESKEYELFVKDNISYQRELKKIKGLLIDPGGL